MVCRCGGEVVAFPSFLDWLRSPILVPLSPGLIALLVAMLGNDWSRRARMPIVSHTRELGLEEVLAAWASEAMLGLTGVLSGDILDFFVVTGEVEDCVDVLRDTGLLVVWAVGIGLDLDRVIQGKVDGLNRPSGLFARAERRGLLLDLGRLRSLADTWCSSARGVGGRQAPPRVESQASRQCRSEVIILILIIKDEWSTSASKRRCSAS